MIIDLSIVVAVYNEDPRNLVILLERVWKTIQPLGLSYEVVFVNDGSGPQTSAALYQIASEVDYVKLVVLSRNFGQQAAISAGLDHAEGQAVVNMDSDCQDPPELIPEMIKLWKEGFDVVYAQRSSRQDRLSKRLSAFVFYRVLALVSSVNIPWDTGDFRLMDRKVVDALARMPERARFLRGQIPWLGFRQTGIAIERGARELGASTYTLKKLLTLAADGLLAFSVAPLYLVPILGAAALLGGVVGLAIWLYLFLGHQAIPVHLALVAFIALIAGVQICCLGFMSVYLSKVLDEVRARPTYLVAECVGLPFARGSERKQLAYKSPAQTVLPRAALSDAAAGKP